MTRRAAEDRQTTAAVTFSDADEELRTTLDNLEDSRNYNRWIMSLIEPYLGRSLVEIGSGHGTFTELLADRADAVVAVEPSERCVEILRQRFDGDSRVAVVLGETQSALAHGPFDSAVMINVLEHIPDDAGALNDLAKMLRPGGRVILWVPAFPLLYSEFDRKIGHCRRYRRAGLLKRLEDAGLQPIRVRYVNALGAVLWLLGARLLRRTPTSKGPILVMDKVVIPVVRRLEKVVTPPFGQSLLAVAMKPE